MHYVDAVMLFILVLITDQNNSDLDRSVFGEPTTLLNVSYLTVNWDTCKTVGMAAAAGTRGVVTFPILDCSTVQNNVYVLVFVMDFTHLLTWVGTNPDPSVQ